MNEHASTYFYSAFKKLTFYTQSYFTRYISFNSLFILYISSRARGLVVRHSHYAAVAAQSLLLPVVGRGRDDSDL